MENHFGERTAWSLLYFLNYAYFDILPIRKFWESVSIYDFSNLYVSKFTGGIGGKGGTFEKRLDSMEMLDLDSVDWKASKKDRNKNGPKWKMLTPMSTPRSSHTVEVFKV